MADDKPVQLYLARDIQKFFEDLAADPQWNDVRMTIRMAGRVAGTKFGFTPDYDKKKTKKK